MIDTIFIITDIAIICAAVYAIIVLNKWHDVAAKLDVLADDFREDMNDLMNEVEGDLDE